MFIDSRSSNLSNRKSKCEVKVQVEDPRWHLRQRITTRWRQQASIKPSSHSWEALLNFSPTTLINGSAASIVECRENQKQQNLLGDNSVAAPSSSKIVYSRLTSSLHIEGNDKITRATFTATQTTTYTWNCTFETAIAWLWGIFVNIYIVLFAKPMVTNFKLARDFRINHFLNLFYLSNNILIL